jgi:hypothetical protein
MKQYLVGRMGSWDVCRLALTSACRFMSVVTWRDNGCGLAVDQGLAGAGPVPG